MPSLWSNDGTDGLGAVPSVLGKSRTAHRPRPSEGTVDITDLRPGQVSVRSHTATLEMEQNENRRINESGIPNRLLPNCLKTPKRGGDSETRNGGL